MQDVRIRQVVLASRDVGSIEVLADIFGFPRVYRDPGVAEFGLVNGVFVLGDQFLEIVVPVSGSAAAGRFIDRSGGTGAYMAIFQVADIAATRKRGDALRIRRVWNADLPDISASHFHPSDIGAAIISVDQPVPASAWRWGGPDWQGASIAGSITGVSVTALDPAALAHRWGEVLDRPARNTGDTWQMPLDGGRIEVREGTKEQVTAFHLEIDGAAEVIARARDAGLETAPGGFRFLGVDFMVVQM